MKWVFDSEVYSNFYMIAFLSNKGDVKSFRHPFSRDDKKQIVKILENDTVMGFNSLNYDLPILGLALNNASDSKIKKASDKIIQNNLKWWESDTLPYCKDHVDLIEVAFGKASLKIYGGRLNSPRMQSLPIHFDKVLTEGEKDLIEDYCINDLKVTAILAKALQPQLKIRRDMTKQYKVNLMSKSDAQIAEAVLKKELPQTSTRVIEPGYTFKYDSPHWLKFQSPELKDALEIVKNTDFVVRDTGKVMLPDEIKTVDVFGKKYKMGIGGLHSTEKKQSIVEDESIVISDHDVASYYPSIILNERLYPEHLGPEFLTVYQDIVDRRLAAKKSGDKVVADTLKIVINGSFGKFGSKWSVLFAPEMLIQVTITGQLALLMLIDMMEHQKIPVISANTDGIVLACPTDRIKIRDKVIAEWESATGFVTEETRYKALHSRDVNNYLAIKPDGRYKGKGVFAKPSMSKNAHYPIVYQAVAKYLAQGVEVSDTIVACDDITKFCAIRTVKGGAIDQDGIELGGAIRWYYAKGVDEPIRYQINGNKVPETDGARALMQLPESIPKDVNYTWYVNKAMKVLEDLGC